MTQVLDVPGGVSFVDRRAHDPVAARPARERRQFTDGHEGFSPDAKELAEAIDQYKLRHRRRFITHQEILEVVVSLGYHK